MYHRNKLCAVRNIHKAISKKDEGRLTKRLGENISNVELCRNPFDCNSFSIIDLVFDEGAPPVAFSSNSVSVQLNFLRQGAGLGVVHDFALPAAPELVRVLPDQISLTRAFWLIRHADDGRVARLSRFAETLIREARAEMVRLEAVAQKDIASAAWAMGLA